MISRSSARFTRAAVASALLASLQAYGNPTGGSIATGSATIVSQGGRVTVTNTPGTVINWQGFSIGAGEVTNFVQQSTSSAVLNRVVGQNPSSIMGALQSNGRVFLTNPNGVLISSNATVSTAGFTATTSEISNSDFVAGRTGWNGIGSFFSTNAPIAGSTISLSSNSIQADGLTAGVDVTLASAGAITISSALVASGALNRVIGANPSTIAGNLQTNGSVFLINPNAVIFGPQSGVGSLVPSTLSVSSAGLGFISGTASPVTVSGSAAALHSANATVSGTQLGAATLSSGSITTLSSGGNVTLSNVTISSGNATLGSGNVTISGATVTGAASSPNQSTGSGTSTLVVSTTGTSVNPLVRSSVPASATAVPTARIALQKREPLF